MAVPGAPLLRLLLLGTALSTATAALAETTWIDLGSITLLGTGLPTDVLTNPASITVIEGDSLKGKAPVSIATLLRDVPGLHVSEEGIERVAIRGETSRRVYNLKGKPIGGHLNIAACARVAFVRRKLFASETRSVQFYGQDGACLFKVYLGRGEARQMIPSQVAAFDALEARLLAA